MQGFNFYLSEQPTRVPVCRMEAVKAMFYAFRDRCQLFKQKFRSSRFRGK